MMDNVISIVVPVYNLEKYIERTVQSIINQTYRNLEILLVDDGSKDHSPEILDNLRSVDSRIKVIHKANGGVTSARLKGVAAATGDWIGFVDGDDLLDSDMFEHLLNNALKYNADISHCGYRMVFPSRVDYYYNSGRLVEQDRLSGVKDLLSGSFVEPGLWNKLYRKSLFDVFLQENTMDTSIKIHEDLLMNYFLFNQSDHSVFEDFCPYQYMLRIGSAATSSVNEHKLMDPVRVQKILLEMVGADSDLRQIVETRLTAAMVKVITIPREKLPEELVHWCRKCRKELLHMLPGILVGKFSIRTKVLSAWASLMPYTYIWLHRMYAHLRGTDRKYEVK